MASGSKILAVVHDDLLRELLRDFLSERFQVSVAGDVLEGTDLLLADGYDLLLVQDNMPVMTGREYIAVLDTCEEFSTPPLVLISADRNLEAQMRKRSDRGFLPMPFGLDELGSLVRQLSPPPVPLLAREKSSFVNAGASGQCLYVD